MREPPWKNLVRHLEDTGYESPYLDRLRARLDAGGIRQSLETEIIREVAHALGRSEDKVNHALLELELAARAVDEAADDDTRAARVARFNQVREDALRARQNLRIHREAVGFRRHHDFEKLYPIPPRLRG
jgi:hypothetical protein